MSITETLPKDFKKKWVAALRSKKYKQGRAELYDTIEDTYCCLGVAEIVAGNTRDKIAGLAFPRASIGCRSPRLLHVDGLGRHIAIELSALNDEDIPFEVIAGLVQENL
jgi:hypothetical protein